MISILILAIAAYHAGIISGFWLSVIILLQAMGFWVRLIELAAKKVE